MNAFDYVNERAHRLAASVTALALTDSHLRAGAEAWVSIRDAIGPGTLSVAHLALERFAPGLHLLPQNPDRVGGDLLDSYVDQYLDTANQFLDRSVKADPHQIEGPVPERILQQQREAAEAQEQAHAEQRATLDDQLKKGRERFDELHRDDSAEQAQRAQEALEEAEKQARAEQETRQAAERQEREAAEQQVREAFEQQEREIEAQEAKAAEEHVQEEAQRKAQEKAEQEAREAAERLAREAAEEREP